jgi:protoheme IX farnesyltransferase
VGTFLLAAGASALNHVQERVVDGRMARTRDRPLPSGRMSVSTALFVAVVSLLLGLATLASVPNQRQVVPLLLLGVLAVVWYNGVYVTLKRVTAFAAVPGALIGAVPPAIGWVAAGGLLTDPLLWLVGAFFFIWQIPHFWLLVLLHGEDYARAGLPSLTTTFSGPQLLRVTFMWVMATAAAGMVLAAVARPVIPWSWSIVMVAASVWLALKAVGLLTADHREQKLFARSFVQINVYALLVVTSLSFAVL